MAINIVIMSFILTEIFLIIAKKIAKKLNIYDIPDSRKIHSNPIPEIGGIAIFFTLLLITTTFGKNNHLLFVILICNSIIFLTGLLDDIIDLSPWTKLLFQFSAATIVIFSGGIKFQIGGHYSGFLNTKAISIIITYLWIIGVTNAINLIDGMDGLAGGISLFAFGAIASISFLKGYYLPGFISLIFSGSIISFLNHNLPPARIFLGDSGSLLLGFNISILSLSVSYKTGAIISIILPSLFVLIPVVDTVYAFLRRLLKGKNPLTNPDNQHIHHRLLLLKFSQNQALIIFYFFSGLFTTLSINLKSRDLQNGVIACLTIILLFFYSIYLFEKNKVYKHIERFNKFTSKIKDSLLKENFDSQQSFVLLNLFFYLFYIFVLITLICFGKAPSKITSILILLFTGFIISTLLSIYLQHLNKMLSFLEYWIDFGLTYLLYLNNDERLIFIFGIILTLLMLYRITFQKNYALLIPSPEDLFILFTIINVYLLKNALPFIKIEYFFLPIILYIARKSIANRSEKKLKKHLLTKSLIFIFYTIAIASGLL